MLEYLTAAEQMSIVSSNLNDTIAGTGARKLEIIGLDNDYICRKEVVELNGTTPVLTANSYIRLARMKITEVGGDATQTNLGDITATSAISATVQERMLIGWGISKSSHYTVPGNKNAYVLKISADITKLVGGQTPVADVTAKIREFGFGWIQPFETELDSSVNGSRVLDLPVQSKQTPKSDIRLTVSTDQDNTRVHALMFIIEETIRDQSQE